MRKLELKTRILTDADVFVIAEIGSNHQGDAEICKRMIEQAAKCGADAVKMQKRDLGTMFTKTALAAPYVNENSYGKTYGEHRARLDWFGSMEFLAFRDLAHDLGLKFIVTPFDETSLKFCLNLNVDALKVASCDVKNTPFLRDMAECRLPMIISTGGAEHRDVRRVVETMDPVNKNYALLHCVSKYPNTDRLLNLSYIRTLRNEFPSVLVGFSSHHSGIMPLMIARTFGATIFEVHFTLNRGWRGTDHGFSLEPKALMTVCEDLRRVNTMIGIGKRRPSQAEKGGFVLKMGKGVYLKGFRKAGHILSADDLFFKAPATLEGLHPYEAEWVVGKSLIDDCSTGVCLRKEWLK